MERIASLLGVELHRLLDPEYDPRKDPIPGYLLTGERRDEE
jgi:hypothetical protein